MDMEDIAQHPSHFSRNENENRYEIGTIEWFDDVLGDTWKGSHEAVEAAACLTSAAKDVVAGIATGGNPEAVFDLGPGSWRTLVSLDLIDITTAVPALTTRGEQVATVVILARSRSQLAAYSLVI